MSMRVGLESFKTCAISNLFSFYLMLVVQDVTSQLTSLAPLPAACCCPSLPS